MRFLHKIVLLLTALVVLSSMIQFFAFDRLFLANTDSLLLETNKKAAFNASEQISAYFKNIVSALRTIASDPKVSGDQELLDKANSMIPEVNAIFVVDKLGIVSRSSGAQAAGQVVSQRDFFQPALRGETYISGVYTSPQGRQIVAVAVPIIRNGSVEGIVAGTVWLHENNLASMFGDKAFGRDGFISIADGNGIIVYHPDKQLVGKKGILFDHLQGPAGSVIAKNFSGQEHYIGYSKIPQLNWRAVVMTPTAEVAKFRTMLFYQIFFVTILTLALVIAIGVYTVRRYIKPLTKVVEAFSSVRKGKYKQIPPDSYDAEFDPIIQVYNETIRKLEEVHATLTGAADMDGLTGAYNRRSFDKVMETLNAQMQSQSLKTLGILLIDIDYFKRLNDTHGHLAGDDVLKEFTAIATEIVGKRSVFRFGGDEFAIILRDIPREAILAYAAEIRLRCEKALSCTVSIGIATYPKNAAVIDELLAAADKALYISKETKNTVTEYSIM